ncbi:hypothetical protein H9Q72_010310 [Fusarium xylarioides]|uniref:DUF7587 domain-containing protein n=1 Tax=Fusarium xylarioides TaxID=221167 RepID=A0A9P7HJ27_9HYPO|nr:hypothetical protein H9Q70_010197 [Fusarium xylarioides]KAG5761591.1 hypothetical protein H9Q72_010310 [Fusarium xylarioides]KAG5776277.1 hypothetical protein H9Q73_010056 [Fusarium xylarioides]
MGTKSEDPINIRMGTIYFTVHSGVSDYDAALPTSVKEALNDSFKSQTTAMLDGRTSLYQPNEPRIFKLRADSNLASETAPDETSGYVQYILSEKGTREKHVNVLLDYFAARTEDIVRENIDNYDIRSRHRIVEECYNQAVQPSGKLNADIFFTHAASIDPHWHRRMIVSEESWSFDHLCDTLDATLGPQLSSEFGEVLKQTFRTDWISFWVKELSDCLLGSTLFNPGKPKFPGTLKLPFEHVPRYLFRVFDAQSTGENLSTLFESTMCAYSISERRTDILSLDVEEASEMLHYHLTKQCFRSNHYTADHQDNLVSWSSSFITAIQYATWRSRVSRTPTSHINICVVDTRNFPQGQFARDTWLLKAYARRTSNPLYADFFQRRLANTDYDIGEYFSQGIIDHGQRSSVFSLQDLVSGGLYFLYPEFAYPYGRAEWTNRVRDLRCEWREEAEHENGDIEYAVRVAEGPLKQFAKWDMTLLLLSFRHRRSIPQVCLELIELMRGIEPAEVCRYDALRRWLEVAICKLSNGLAAECDEMELDSDAKMMYMLEAMFSDD